MHSLTTVIIAKDEEHNIERCLRSVRMLGEMLVVDTGSKDRTMELAASLGARVTQIEFNGFGPAKQAAVGMAESEYVLNVDADEVVSSQLAESIKCVLASDDPSDCYEMSRVTNFCGSWVMTSGWYPEYVLRLFRPSVTQVTSDIVHESIECGGTSGCLDGLLLHYSYPDLAHFSRKMLHYSQLGAEKYRTKGGRVAALRIVVNPLISFLKHLILKRGFMDGMTGLWIAALSAVGQFYKYVLALRKVPA